VNPYLQSVVRARLRRSRKRNPKWDGVTRRAWRAEARLRKALAVIRDLRTKLAAK